MYFCLDSPRGVSQHPWIRDREHTAEKKPTWQGLVDGHSVSNETDWRHGVSCSITLSSALRGFGIGRALLKTGGDGKPVSDEEGSPEPPDFL